MKNPSHPPSKAYKGKPLTAKRKKILELAMAQLKKTRAQMDPNVLSKIRSIIAGNPKIMKGLGLDKMPEDKGTAKKASITQPKLKPAVAIEKKKISKDEEKIDQAKNMETIAKLMTLKPTEIKNIKEILLKNK